MTPSQKWLLLLDAILLVLYKNADLPDYLALILMAICNFVSLSVVGKVLVKILKYNICALMYNEQIFCDIKLCIFPIAIFDLSLL